MLFSIGFSMVNVNRDTLEANMFGHGGNPPSPTEKLHSFMRSGLRLWDVQPPHEQDQKDQYLSIIKDIKEIFLVNSKTNQGLPMLYFIMYLFAE